MSRHSQGSGTGLAIVLIVVLGGATVLVMLAVAGAAFFWFLADAPVQVETAVWDEPPTAENMGDVTGDVTSVDLVAEQGGTFPLRVENATRQADGGWKIFASGTRPRPGKIESIRFTNMRVADLAVGECQVALPSGPFSKTIDFVIHTPPVPAERETIRIDYVVHLQGSEDSGGGFSSSLDGALQVDLKNRASRGPVKAESLPE